MFPHPSRSSLPQLMLTPRFWCFNKHLQHFLHSSGQQLYLLHFRTKPRKFSLLLNQPLEKSPEPYKDEKLCHQRMWRPWGCSLVLPALLSPQIWAIHQQQKEKTPINIKKSHTCSCPDQAKVPLLPPQLWGSSGGAQKIQNSPQLGLF